MKVLRFNRTSVLLGSLIFLSKYRNVFYSSHHMYSLGPTTIFHEDQLVGCSVVVARHDKENVRSYCAHQLLLITLYCSCHALNNDSHVLLFVYLSAYSAILRWTNTWHVNIINFNQKGCALTNRFPESVFFLHRFFV